MPSICFESLPPWAHKAILVTIGLVVIWACMRVSLSLLHRLSKKYEPLVKHVHLARTVLRIMISSLGLLIIMDSLGISITPIMASLGIGGLAIGLALKDTLANYFAGFYLLVDRPIRIGDFIRLESGEEGYVDSIGWRSAKIRMLANKTVIVPNNTLSSSRIVNYDLPSPDVAVLVELGVHYDSDLAKVEEVTIAAAKELQRTVAGAVRDFVPFIRYHTFADSSINFTVILRAENFVANYLIKHEFIKLLHERYNANGIIIPFPIRTLYMAGGAGEKIL